MRKIGLFIPCYIDLFYPTVAISCLQLLEKLGCDVTYPADQTCCGQPLANSGMEGKAHNIYRHFVQTFSDFEYIVAPSASCTYHVKHHYDIVEQSSSITQIRERTYDISTFLLDVLKIKELPARFPHRVGLHQSCHGLRGLRMAKSSELVSEVYSSWRELLGMVSGIELINLDRADECCGFGGTFAVTEEAVSVKMGKDRIQDHMENRAEFITSGDMSCLMHMDGIIRRNEWPIRIKHIVEILNSV